MKRHKRLRRVSEKRLAYIGELIEVRDEILSHPCERCGNRAEVVHHKLRRSQGGGNDRANLAGLCDTCHTWVHNHPGDAYANGWLIRSH